MRNALYIIAFIFITIGIAATIRFSMGKETNSISTNSPASSAYATGNSTNQNIGIEVEVLEEYKLPSILTEISGLVYLDQSRFACLQDELGTIFIYNTESEEIEKEIEFAKKGDFEGLTIAGNDAFALRSDGTIFQVINYAGKDPKTVEHKTHLTSKQNCEGIIYDSQNGRLLVTIKESEPESDNWKGIYSLQLNDFKMAKEPAFKINLEDRILEDLKRKKDGSQMMPSGIAIHPINGDMYVIEGVKPKLLIMDRKGKIKSVTELDKDDFNQPEGISFSPEGQLYISNEGGKGDGDILKVKLSGN